jgi:hypothetical protein
MAEARWTASYLRKANRSASSPAAFAISDVSSMMCTWDHSLSRLRLAASNEPLVYRSPRRAEASAARLSG